MFIHPEVVMTAGHCCGAGEIKAICGGKVRPGRKLAQSKAMVKVRHACIAHVLHMLHL